MRLIGAVLSVVLLACGSAPKAPPLLDLQAKTFSHSPVWLASTCIASASRGSPATTLGSSLIEQQLRGRHL
jgi:hypothetical protein